MLRGHDPLQENDENILQPGAQALFRISVPLRCVNTVFTPSEAVDEMVLKRKKKRRRKEKENDKKKEKEKDQEGEKKKIQKKNTTTKRKLGHQKNELGQQSKNRTTGK